jgi:hypothetical protein
MHEHKHEHKHDKKCCGKCGCEFPGEEKYKEWVKNCEEKYGWYFHMVNEDPNSPTGINAHTHGVLEKYNHPDFQVVLPVDPKIIQNIFSTVVENVKNGQKYKSGEIYTDVIKNYSVKLLEFEEGNRTVLRIIFPDKSGNLEEKEIGDFFAIQYKKGENEMPPELISEFDELLSSFGWKIENTSPFTITKDGSEARGEAAYIVVSFLKKMERLQKEKANP